MDFVKFLYVLWAPTLFLFHQARGQTTEMSRLKLPKSAHVTQTGQGNLMVITNLPDRGTQYRIRYISDSLGNRIILQVPQDSTSGTNRWKIKQAGTNNTAILRQTGKGNTAYLQQSSRAE